MIELEHDNLKTIYDLFALCCDEVMNDCKKSGFEIPDCDEEDEEYTRIDGIIASYVCMREVEGRCIAFEVLLHDLALVFWTCNSVQAYKIAKAIDENVSIEEPISENQFSDFVTYSSLNRFYDDRIRIYPVLESTFVTKSNGIYKEANNADFPLFRNEKPASSCLGKYFDNYIILDKSYIEKYPLKILRAKKDSSFAKEFNNKDVLKIELVPFTQVDIEELCNITYRGGYFTVDGWKKEKENTLLQKMKDYYADVIREKADFIIFPEMLFSEKLLEYSKKYARKAEMVINGSIWNGGHNRSVLSMNGSEVLVHYKRCPFNLKKEINGRDKNFKEKLNFLSDERKTYHILEIEGFGRITIGICRDLDYNETQELWKIMRTNLLFIPAYSPSKDLEGAAQHLSNLYNMVVIVCNACAAMKPKHTDVMEGSAYLSEKKPVGFISLPGIKDGTRTPVTVHYYKKNKCSLCKNICKGHRLIINLKKFTETHGREAKTYDWEWE